MDLLFITGTGLLLTLVLFLFPRKAAAHCDTMDGPTVADGKKALAANNINYALKWVFPEYEEELSRAFDLSMKVRKLNKDAEELADRYFLENLVRIHRLGEGEPFSGIKPAGTPIDARVRAADRSIELGNLSPLETLVSPELMPELEHRFEKVMALKDFDIDDVEAGREYIFAYVSFFKLAEGEEHEHQHRHKPHEGHKAGH